MSAVAVAARGLRRRAAVLAGTIACGALPVAAQGSLPQTLRAADTLGAVHPLDDDDPRARAQLEALRYPATEFEVAIAERPAGSAGEHLALVSFPSPKPSGDDVVDRVACEWFAPRARPGDAAPAAAPAVVILHILDGRLVLERAIARALSVQGVHAFVMHLPGYQSRRKGPGRPGVQQALVFGRQGIADARRARDAVAVLPGIDGRRVSLLGVSLGAILGASAAALDGAFADTFLFLAGGDLRTLYRDGQLEIARLRRAVAEAGMSEAEIFAALDGVDPQALAHRLPKDTTWLWSARQDPVVPAANARALGAAAHLDDQHHIWFPGTHHSGVIQLPDFVRQVALRARNGTPPVAR